MRQKNKGKIIPNGVVLKTHESATVVFLTEQGYDIELIPKINIQGVHTPDIRIGNLKWEMKSPVGEGNSLDEKHYSESSKTISKHYHRFTQN